MLSLDQLTQISTLSPKRREKQIYNYFYAIEFLDRYGIEYEKITETHFKIGTIDFYPLTGRFVDSRNGIPNKGVLMLIRKVQNDLKSTSL